jgi:hypothetical protein
MVIMFTIFSLGLVSCLRLPFQGHFISHLYLVSWGQYPATLWHVHMLSFCIHSKASLPIIKHDRDILKSQDEKLKMFGSTSTPDVT